jgi:hypothetical protein
MSMPAIRHFLQFSDLTADDYAWRFERAARIQGLREVPPAG